VVGGGAAGVVIPPMGVGEIVDGGLTLARRNFRLLVTIAAWGVLPGFAVQALVSAAGTSPIAPVLGSLVGAVPHALAWIALSVACAWLVDPQFADGSPTTAGSFRVALRRVFAMVRLMLVLAVVALPLVIFFPVGIYLVVRWAAATNVVVVERAGALRALRRSWELTARAWWHTAVVILLATIAIAVLELVLTGMVGMVIGIAQFLLQMPTATVVLAATFRSAISLIVLPFTAAILTVLYFELRARAEGYDLNRRIVELAAARP